MRVLGLDWGQVRVGAAMSDEDGRLAFPLQRPLPAKSAPEEVKKLVEEYGIRTIVLGRPLALSGKETESTRRAEKFSEKLKALTGAEIIMIDERLSTKASSQALRRQGMKEEQQRQAVDNVSAALLLQQYLDNL